MCGCVCVCVDLGCRFIWLVKIREGWCIIKHCLCDIRNIKDNRLTIFQMKWMFQVCRHGNFKIEWNSQTHQATDMSWSLFQLPSNWSLVAFCCAYVADIYEHSVTMRPIGQPTPGHSAAARGDAIAGDCNNGILNSHLKWGAAKLITCHLLTSSISVHMRAMSARSGQGLLQQSSNPWPIPAPSSSHNSALPLRHCEHTQKFVRRVNCAHLLTLVSAVAVFQLISSNWDKHRLSISLWPLHKRGMTYYNQAYQTNG